MNYKSNMKIILGIPSGYRVKKLLKCIESWRKVCDFEIHVITWDGSTTDALRDYKRIYVLDVGLPMKSFAVNHNELAGFLSHWDVYICGADDLYPGNAISEIEKVCQQNPGKVIWVRDGLFDAIPTHPIITRGWYEEHGSIFDEDYRHNFTDTDLFIRTLMAGEIVKCFEIGFDHRHPLKTGEPADEIYTIGNESFTADRKIFYRKHPNADQIMQDLLEIKV